MVTIDRERLTNEKQNNKANIESARLPKEAMLLRDSFKFTKPSLDPGYVFLVLPCKKRIYQRIKYEVEVTLILILTNPNMLFNVMFNVQCY